jgi:hypothetical protein
MVRHISNPVQVAKTEFFEQLQMSFMLICVLVVIIICINLINRKLEKIALLKL